MKVDLGGFRELEQALIDLEQFTGRTTSGKNAVKRGMIKAMKRIEDRARQLAPKDDGVLERSIVTKPERAKRAGRNRFERQVGVTIVTGPAPRGKLSRSNAGWQENGTVAMPANPYMRPAADGESANVVAEVVELIRDEVGKTTDRARKRAARAGR